MFGKKPTTEKLQQVVNEQKLPGIAIYLLPDGNVQRIISGSDEQIVTAIASCLVNSNHTLMLIRKAMKKANRHTN